jgi:tetratricopeptide (TPR) repeat protein
MTDLAEAYRGEGRYAESEKLLNEVLQIQRRVPASDNPYLGLTLYGLGCTAARRGRVEEALEYLREAVEQGLDAAEVRRMAIDDDFKLVRGDSRFAALVARAKKGAGL